MKRDLGVFPFRWANWNKKDFLNVIKPIYNGRKNVFQESIEKVVFLYVSLQQYVLQQAAVL